MSSFWNFAFGIILVAVWIIAGGFVTQANIYLSPYKDKDDDFHQAYWYTFWAAFVTWTLIGLFIIMVILSVVGLVALFGSGAGEAAEAEEESSSLSEISEKNEISKGVSWATVIFLIFALILVGVTGILASIAASSMIKSSNFKNDVAKLDTAYKDCIIAASMCLGAGGLLLVGIITYVIIDLNRDAKLKAQQKLINKQKGLELSEVKRLQEKSMIEKAQEQAEFKERLKKVEEEKILEKVQNTPSK